MTVRKTKLFRYADLQGLYNSVSGATRVGRVGIMHHQNTREFHEIEGIPEWARRSFEDLSENRVDTHILVEKSKVVQRDLLQMLGEINISPLNALAKRVINLKKTKRESYLQERKRFDIIVSRLLEDHLGPFSWCIRWSISHQGVLKLEVPLNLVSLLLHSKNKGYL